MHLDLSEVRASFPTGLVRGTELVCAQIVVSGEALGRNLRLQQQVRMDAPSKFWCLWLYEAPSCS